jgi:hypothetical protein
MKVFVAVVPMKYEVMAVADTEEKARRLAASEAFHFLKENGRLGDIKTLKDVAEWYGVNVTEVEMNTAIVC